MPQSCYYDGVSIFLLLVVVYCEAEGEVDYATCGKDLEGWCFCSEEARDCVCTDGLVRFGQPKSEDHPARFLPPEQWNDLQESGVVLCKKATFGRLPDGVDSTNYKMCQCCKDPNNCPAAPPETTPEPAPPETTPEPTCHPPECMESNSYDNDCCGKPDVTHCRAGFEKIEWGPGAIECHVGGYFKTCCVPVPTTTPDPTAQVDATPEPTTTPQPATTPKPTTTSQLTTTTVMNAATTVPATTPSPKNLTSGPKAPLRNGTKREVMEPAQVKALAGTVSVAVGAAICVAVAATGPAAIAIIGQVQVLTQLGKVGGKADGSNAGALAQFSEGFGWANAELPVSFIGDRRAGARRKMSVMVGQTYEEATDPACQDKESLTEEQKAKCNGCGLMNGVPLLEKLSVVFGSLAVFFCVRSSLQMIWTKCLRKAPMGALEFPVWEGPLLIVHWFGACESLSHTLGRPCPTWFGIAAVFIIVGPLAFLVFSVFRVGQHLRSGNIVWEPSPPITWSETRVKMAEVKETGYKGILAKIALANAWYSSKRHKGEWVKSPTSRKWLFLIKEFHDSSWKYFAWLALRKLVLAMVMTLTFEFINSTFMIILHVADLALMLCILPHEDNIANLQETWAACTNLVTIVMASLPAILGEMPDFMADSMLIAFALAGTVTAAGGALVGAVGAILGQVFGLCGGLCGGVEVPVDFGVEADLEVEGAEIEEDLLELGDAGEEVAGELMDEAGEIMDGAEDIADEAMNEAGEMMDPGDENEGQVGGGALGLSNSQLAGVAGMAVLGSHLKDPSGQGGAVQGYDDVDFVHVAFKLLLDFVEAGGEGSKERAEFERQLIEDLARASGLKATCFEVEKVEKGSIIAHILIHQDESGEGPGPSSAVALLRQQLEDDSSALRLGVITQHLDSLECCSPCAHAELEKAVPIACPPTASPSRWKSVAGNMQNLRKYANTFAANYFERRSKEEAEKAASKIDTTSVQKKQNQAGAEESTLEKVAVKVQARANRSTRPVQKEQKEQIQAGVEKSKFSTTPSPYFLPSLPLEKGAVKVEVRTTRATSSGGGDQSHLSHGSSGSSSVRSKSSTRCRKTLEERADQTQEEMADEERGCHALGGVVAAIDMVRASDMS